MISEPGALIGFADSGAHIRNMAFYNFPLRMLKLVRDAYSIDPEHPLARALAAGYEEVTGEALEATGIKVVADGAVFQAVGGIPTVYHGPRGEGAHADV